MRRLAQGLLIAGVLVLARLVFGLLLPIVTDEAYYLAWAQRLDWGYFDHPPVVAWLAWIGRQVPGIETFLSQLTAVLPMLNHETPIRADTLGLRFGPLLLSIGTLALVWSMLGNFGIKDWRARAAGLLLISGSLYSLGASVLVTPDAGLTFCWIFALNEAAVALTKDERRWLSAGVVTGLGILSKYIMVVIGPVFLVALWRRKGALRRPWPYVGGLLCLLTISPHLLWQAQHDWVTVKFQMGHGFLGSHAGAGLVGPEVPHFSPARPGSSEWQLAEYFLSAEEPTQSKPEKPWLVRSLSRFGDFWGGVLGMWGLMLLPLAALFWRRRKGLRQEISDTQGGLAATAALVPLFVFGTLSLFQSVEAHWPAVYLSGAALFFARQQPRLRPFFLGASLNALLIMAIAAYTALPPNLELPGLKWLLAETHGFSALAAYTRDLSEPKFAESYQLVSMQRLYGAGSFTQFPGMTRPSEFTRQASQKRVNFGDGFWLIHTGIVPPSIDGFSAISLVEVRDCRSGLYPSPSRRGVRYIPTCRDFIHRWFLVEYKQTLDEARSG